MCSPPFSLPVPPLPSRHVLCRGSWHWRAHNRGQVQGWHDVQWVRGRCQVSAPDSGLPVRKMSPSRRPPVAQHISRTPFPSSLPTCLPASLPACPPLSLRSTTPRRILGKLEGVSRIATDVGAKSVVVSLAQGSPTTKEALLEALQKWGKAAAKSVELDE